MKKLPLALALLSLASTVAVAQSSAAHGPRWAAYAGCWEPASIDGADAPAINPRVCVVPTSDLGADLISIVDHKITDRSHVEVDGARRQINNKGCAGWDAASFSASGRRIYFESEQTCEFGVQRKTTGIFSVGTNGRWTNIVDVSAGTGHSLRAIHYAPMHVDSTFPPEIVTAIGDREQAIATARIAARSPITIDEVADASKVLGPGVVDAWIASDPQRFDLDAKTLVRLADGGVKPSTIDVMVAVSHPDVFHVSPTGAAAATEMQRQYATNERARANYDCYAHPMDPWGYYDTGLCSPYMSYGYSPFSPYYYGYGYNPYYGYGYNGYNYYGGSSVIVVVTGDTPARHGKMTKNGYTTSTTSSSGSTTDRTSSGSSGSSQGSSGSSGGSSGGRTAQRKPPADYDSPPPREPQARQPRDDATSSQVERTTSAATSSSSSGAATGRTAVPKPPSR